MCIERQLPRDNSMYHLSENMNLIDNDHQILKSKSKHQLFSAPVQNESNFNTGKLASQCFSDKAQEWAQLRFPIDYK